MGDGTRRVPAVTYYGRRSRLRGWPSPPACVKNPKGRITVLGGLRALAGRDEGGRVRSHGRVSSASVRRRHARPPMVAACQLIVLVTFGGQDSQAACRVFDGSSTGRRRFLRHRLVTLRTGGSAVTPVCFPNMAQRTDFRIARCIRRGAASGRYRYGEPSIGGPAERWVDLRHAESFIALFVQQLTCRLFESFPVLRYSTAEPALFLFLHPTYLSSTNRALFCALQPPLSFQV